MKHVIFTLLFCISSLYSVAQCSNVGTISFEKWNNVQGADIQSLQTATNNYQTIPNSSGSYTSFSSPVNAGDNYGLRLRGYICAPQTGTYRFWILGDNEARLIVSSSSAVSSNVVASIPLGGFANAGQWNKYPSQRSMAINLVAGQQYYIEAILKEGTGPDRLSVGWAKPGQSTTQPSQIIPGANLVPFPITPICGCGNPLTQSFALSNIVQNGNRISFGLSSCNATQINIQVLQNGNIITQTTKTIASSTDLFIDLPNNVFSGTYQLLINGVACRGMSNTLNFVYTAPLPVCGCNGNPSFTLSNVQQNVNRISFGLSSCNATNVTITATQNGNTIAQVTKPLNSAADLYIDLPANTASGTYQLQVTGNTCQGTTNVVNFSYTAPLPVCGCNGNPSFTLSNVQQNGNRISFGLSSCNATNVTITATQNGNTIAQVTKPLNSAADLYIDLPANTASGTYQLQVTGNTCQGTTNVVNFSYTAPLPVCGCNGNPSFTLSNVQQNGNRISFGLSSCNATNVTITATQNGNTIAQVTKPLNSAADLYIDLPANTASGTYQLQVTGNTCQGTTNAVNFVYTSTNLPSCACGGIFSISYAQAIGTQIRFGLNNACNLNNMNISVWNGSNLIAQTNKNIINPADMYIDLAANVSSGNYTLQVSGIACNGTTQAFGFTYTSSNPPNGNGHLVNTNYPVIPTTVRDKINWNQFPEFHLDSRFKIIYQGPRHIYDTLGLQSDALRHGFSHQYVQATLKDNFLPRANKAGFENLDTNYEPRQAGDPNDMPYIDYASPWGNNYPALKRYFQSEYTWYTIPGNGVPQSQWIRTDRHYELGFGQRVQNDIVALDEEYVWYGSPIPAWNLHQTRNNLLPPSIAALPANDWNIFVDYQRASNELKDQLYNWHRDTVFAPNTEIGFYSFAPYSGYWDGTDLRGSSSLAHYLSRADLVASHCWDNIPGNFSATNSTIGKTAYMAPQVYPLSHIYQVGANGVGAFNTGFGNQHLLIPACVERNKIWFPNKKQYPFLQMWAWLGGGIPSLYGEDANHAGMCSTTPDYAEAQVIYPIMCGADGVWLWDDAPIVNFNTANTPVDYYHRHNYAAYEYATKGLMRLAAHNWFFSGTQTYYAPPMSDPYYLSLNRSPFWRAVVKDDSILVVACNIWGVNASEGTQTTITLPIEYNGWRDTLTLVGRDIFLGAAKWRNNIRMSNVQAEPLRFLQVGVQESKGNALLSWTTNNSTDNQGFEVEKSLDGLTFESIAWVEASNDSSYHFSDIEFKQNAFYRIRQIDLAGVGNYSNVVAVNKAVGELFVKVYPNPVIEDYFVLSMPTGKKEIVVLDMAGKEVFSGQTEEVLHKIDTDNWSSGQYMLNLSSGEQQVSVLISIQ